MNGYQVTFFTERNQRQGGQQKHEWLLDLAMSLGIGGGTVIDCAEGSGRSGKMHMVHLFSLRDQPMEVTMAMTEAQLDALFARLEAEKANMFYLKAACEFGKAGASVATP